MLLPMFLGTIDNFIVRHYFQRIAQSSDIAWRKQANTVLETSFLIAGNHNPGRCYECYGGRGGIVFSLSQLGTLGAMIVNGQVRHAHSRNSGRNVTGLTSHFMIPFEAHFTG